MTSACIVKDTLRNGSQVFLKFRDSVFEICLHLINLNFTSYYLASSPLSSDAGTSKKIPLDEKRNILTLNTDHFLISTSSIQLLQQKKIYIVESKISSWPPMSQWNQWTPMYSTWSNFRTSQAHIETTPLRF